ncbi:flagellar hook-basal body complex protein FliE [Salipaludibacillus neizhouensis]|uniref:Flagellar hook-basal body complex protein FliE n=2 Tax=Bacillaceae TaxID=186817 RepID=A0A3A9KFM2_9BACI|nr:flagellar hook-basal body complex protein FliE [Salipaludibacillus neizhouensis]
MDINPLQQTKSIMNPQIKNNNTMSTPHEAQVSFKTWLNEAITNVNDTQVNSTVMTEKMARGEQVDLHDVMIASQKATVTLQTTTEIRNKAIEAYQEVMRMQV